LVQDKLPAWTKRHWALKAEQAHQEEVSAKTKIGHAAKEQAVIAKQVADVQTEASTRRLKSPKSINEYARPVRGGRDRSRQKPHFRYSSSVTFESARDKREGLRRMVPSQELPTGAEREVTFEAVDGAAPVVAAAAAAAIEEPYEELYSPTSGRKLSPGEEPHWYRRCKDYYGGEDRLASERPRHRSYADGASIPKSPVLDDDDDDYPTLTKAPLRSKSAHEEAKAVVPTLSVPPPEPEPEPEHKAASHSESPEPEWSAPSFAATPPQQQQQLQTWGEISDTKNGGPSSEKYASPMPYNGTGHDESRQHEMRELESLCQWNLAFEKEASSLRIDAANADTHAQIAAIEAELDSLLRRESEKEAQDTEFKLYKKANHLKLDSVKINLALDSVGPRRDKVQAIFASLPAEACPDGHIQVAEDARRSFEFHRLMQAKSEAIDDMNMGQVKSPAPIEKYVEFQTTLNHHLAEELNESDVRNEEYHKKNAQIVREREEVTRTAARYYSPRGPRCTMIMDTSKARK